MAIFAHVLVPAGEAAIKIAALAASTASSEQVLGNGMLFAINGDQDLTIAFGVAGMAAPTNAAFRIPANQTYTFDLGRNYDRIRVFNLSSTTAANIYIQPLSRF